MGYTDRVCRSSKQRQRRTSINTHSTPAPAFAGHTDPRHAPKPETTKRQGGTAPVQQPQINGRFVISYTCQRDRDRLHLRRQHDAKPRQLVEAKTWVGERNAPWAMEV